MEQMEPVEYLSSAYYEHWLHAVEHYGVRAGALDPDEIEKRYQYYLENPDAPLPDKQDPALVEFIEAVIPAGATAVRDTGKVAQFAVGDRVTVVADAPRGHTRKASYIRGKTGVIELAHGEMIYPDAAGNGLGEAPEHVYTVVFTNEELWGADAAEPNGSVTFDVWEPYIVAATSQESAA
jgi:nitrile hydratase